MGYEVRKRKRKKGEKWFLYFRDFTTAGRKDTYIPETAYLQHGFHPSMDIEDAKEKAKQLNSLAKGYKKQEQAKVRILKQIRDKDALSSAHFPPTFRADFEETFLREHVGVGVSGYEKYKKALVHWHWAMSMVEAINVPSKDWAFRSRAIYEYMRKKHISYEYSRKILRVLNLWGLYLNRRTGVPYELVTSPRGPEKEAINDAWYASGKKTKESLPLNPQELESAKGALKPEQYRWLFISIWLGLRPNEIDQLIKPNSYRLSMDSEGTTILAVYQPKLTGLPREKRFKRIPLFLPEQLQALTYIQQCALKRPLVKTLERYIKPGLNTYGGRKGFVDLMLGKGQDITNISQWMGHQQLSTTWTHYKDKQQVRYKKPA